MQTHPHPPTTKLMKFRARTEPDSHLPEFTVGITRNCAILGEINAPDHRWLLVPAWRFADHTGPGRPTMAWIFQSTPRDHELANSETPF